MTAEDQIIRKRRLRDAELMPLIVRLETAGELEVAQAVIIWDDEDIQFAQTTRLGRKLVDRFNAINPVQIGQWSEDGILWEN